MNSKLLRILSWLCLTWFRVAGPIKKLNVIIRNDPEAVSLLKQVKKEFYQLEKNIQNRLESHQDER